MLLNPKTRKGTNQMKKLLSLLLVIATVSVLLVSCADEPATTTATAGVTTEEPLEGQDAAYTAPDEIANDTSRIKVTGVTVDQKTFECAVSSLFVLLPKVSPADATYKDVIYTSSDPDVVNYNEALGMFTASVDGTAKVRITTKDGGYYTTVIVKVGTGVKAEKTADPYELTGLKLSVSEIEMGSGDNMYVTATPIPETAKLEGGITWTSTDSNIAYVDGSLSTGYVLYAVSAGEATITATTVKGGFKATIKVTVDDHDEKAVASVTLDKTEKTLSVGGSFTLSATVKPDTAVNKFIIWISSDENVVTVDSSGKVTAVAPGTATVTVMTIDGGFTASCTVTVK